MKKAIQISYNDLFEKKCMLVLEFRSIDFDRYCKRVLEIGV